MLLQSLIAQQQLRYEQLQEQIEQLQEQQRQIQAFMQQLGSVESKMTSAVYLVQEAIASINEVCPDELANFELSVNGLFGKPVGILVAGSDNDEPDGDDDPTPPIPPTPPTSPSDEHDDVTLDVPSVVVVDEPVLVTAGTMTEIKAIVAGMSYQRIKNVLTDYKRNTKGKQMELKEQFLEFCETQSESQLQRIFEYLNKGKSQLQGRLFAKNHQEVA